MASADTSDGLLSNIRSSRHSSNVSELMVSPPQVSIQMQNEWWGKPDQANAGALARPQRPLPLQLHAAPATGPPRVAASRNKLAAPASRRGSSVVSQPALGGGHRLVHVLTESLPDLHWCYTCLSVDGNNPFALPGACTTNRIRTSKYTPLTFLPVNLFQQFRRLANLYFLVVVVLQLVPDLSPTSWFTTVCPLVFVLGVNCVKEAVDDRKRHQR